MHMCPTILLPNSKKLGVFKSDSAPQPPTTSPLRTKFYMLPDGTILLLIKSFIKGDCEYVQKVEQKLKLTFATYGFKEGYDGIACDTADATRARDLCI